MSKLVLDRLDRAAEQYMLMAKSLEDQPDRLPKTIDAEGKLVTTSSRDWVSGFLPGTLWMLYEYSQDEALMEMARMYTARIEREKDNLGTHDLGFMLFCSFGNGLQITGDTAYRAVLLAGAESLITRFNPAVGCIQSWNANERWKFPVIVDNMMNLEFLCWASKVSGNPKYRDICITHADTTIAKFYRADNSAYHVVSFDPANGGAVEERTTHQGFAAESAWARGQAWGLYGFTVMFRETREQRYLDQATKIADFLLNHPNFPPDGIPYWDFDAPDIPNALRDASAGAIMASALLELSGFVDGAMANRYIEVAEKQLRTLSSPAYFAELGTNGNFILKHSVGNLRGGVEVDVPLAYADYYYVEALIRWLLNK